MSGLVHAEFDGMAAAAAGVGALSSTRASGAAGTLPVVAATVPAGFDEVSAMNKGVVTMYGAHLAAMLGLSEVFQEAYAASIQAASASYAVADAVSGSAISAVAAL